MYEILFKLFDILLGGLLESRRARKMLIQEFETLKKRILYVGVTNDLPVELSKLRTFIIENKLTEHPGFNKFFSKWLTNPMVVAAIAALNVFSIEDIEQIQTELKVLHL